MFWFRKIKWKHIVIHHSLTKDSETVSWNAIRKYHTENLGFRNIGYHYGIELINNEYEILYGRSLLQSGAHTKGMNSQAIGICCVGNYDLIEPPPEMIGKLIFLLTDLMRIYNIPANNIHGHNEYSYKTCPGTKFNIDDLRLFLK